MAEKNTYIHKNYLVNEVEYEKAKKFWEDFFAGIAQEYNTEKQWFTFSEHLTKTGGGEVWHPIYMANEFNTISPILRKVRKRPNKLIFLTVMDGRNLTTPDQDGQPGIIDASVGQGAWDTGYTTGEVAELKLWILPTSYILPRIKSCIQEWMKADVNEKNMHEYIMRNKLKS